MAYRFAIHNRSYRFDDLKTVLAKASPFRSGDALAGLAADSHEERIAAQFVLADLPLRTFLQEAIIPYETDEVTRLILDTHDPTAFAPVAHLTVGDFRDWLLTDTADPPMLQHIRRGLTPEMVAAVSKLMRNQDLIAVAQKGEVITRFRTTVGQAGRLAVRLQPNHPTDDPKGIAASIIDGLLYGCGDAMIGINPATDSPASVARLLNMLDDIREKWAIPTQSCVLSHLTTTLKIIDKAPVDLVFQSIAGTERANQSFGINLGMLHEAHQAATALQRGPGWPSGNVFRDRSGIGAVGQCPSRRGPADLRGAGLRGGPSLRPISGQLGGGIHWAGVPL